SLGLAITTPVLMFSNLNLRAVQATDANRLFSFTEYLKLRSLTTIGALTVIVIITLAGRYDRRTSIIILAVALAKSIEALSDIHYGLFQLNDRLDQTGKSMMLRGAFSVGAVTAGLVLTRDVFWACIALALGWIATLLTFDVRQARRFTTAPDVSARLHGTARCNASRPSILGRQWHLARLALPLGIVTTLLSLNLNIPRYFIEACLGEHQLGLFSALAYATVAMTLISDSLGHCALPRMSRLFAEQQIATFRLLLIKLSVFGCGLGLCGLAAAYLAGRQLLDAFYSAEYSAGNQIFTVLMLAAAFHCVAGMLTSGMLSARCFIMQVPMLAIVVACTAFACAHLIPVLGLMGAAWATVAGGVVRLTLTGAAVAYVIAVGRER